MSPYKACVSNLFFLLYFMCAATGHAQIADNIDLPFVNDPAVIGRWESVDFVKSPETFDPAHPRLPGPLSLKTLTFSQDGQCDAVPCDAQGTKRTEWTKGVVLNKAARIASRYTLQETGPDTYLFFEWKSGDYTERGQKPGYYVLKKASDSVSHKVRRPFSDAFGYLKKGPATVFHTIVPSPTPPTTPAAPEEDPLQRNLPLGIHRHPNGFDFRRGALAELPRFNPRDHRNPFPVDLRGYDLRSLNLAGREGDLLRSDFDDRTQWPTLLPEGFDPQKVRETGKNPGLGVRALHQQGITGRGVGVAILDQALLVEHVEYQDRLRHYEEIHWPSWQNPLAQMHGPAVASIACGRTVGVAPEADLYYIAEQHGDFRGEEFDWDFHWLALSIDRVLQINRQLPPEKRIRVISASVGWIPSRKGYEEVMAATRRAGEQGVFVVSVALETTHGFKFMGLGRDPLADPDQPGSYQPGFFWQKEFLRKPAPYGNGSTLLVPMDARTTASPTGASEYVHYDTGGMSWAVPYLAGLYALACQVNPAVTPDQFWKTALETGDTIHCRLEGKEYPLGPIVNPTRLMERMKKSGENGEKAGK